MKKIFFISRLPAPYREPLFQQIHEQVKGLDFRVFYQIPGASNNAWNLDDVNQGALAYTYKRQVVCPQTVKKLTAKEFWNAGKLLWRTLSAEAPDLVVVHGYYFALSWVALLWCFRHRTPYGLRSDTNVHILKEHGLKGKLKRRFLSFLVRRSRVLLFIGSANRDFWKKFGAEPKQLLEARYAVDPAMFNPRIPEVALRDFRQKYNLEGKFVFLYSGRLVRRKGIELLLTAYRELRREYPDIALLIAGDGDLFPPMETREEEEKNSIVYLGQVSYKDLPTVYHASDVFVAPYRDEPWGLTLNEALQCGKGIIASTGGTCGAAIDLLEDERNGYALKELSSDAVLDAMRRAYENREKGPAWKEVSLQKANEWNFSSVIHAFEQLAGEV